MMVVVLTMTDDGWTLVAEVEGVAEAHCCGLPPDWRGRKIEVGCGGEERGGRFDVLGFLVDERMRKRKGSLVDLV